MKWYNKAVIYNKTAYFIINSCFIKPNFYDWMPLKHLWQVIFKKSSKKIVTLT